MDQTQKLGQRVLLDFVERRHADGDRRMGQNSMSGIAHFDESELQTPVSGAVQATEFAELRAAETDRRKHSLARLVDELAQ